jgi:hypothetical protein
MSPCGGFLFGKEVIILAKKKVQNHHHTWVIAIASALVIVSLLLFSYQNKEAKGGFDEFGYNYKARLFNGDLDGADRNLDGTYWGDPTYANDKLVMKWSKAWDDARFNGEPWNCDAWTSNEYNGKGKGGSGEVWHYKIVWVGPDLEESECWREGGYPIWGQFEVVMDQGTVMNEHFWGAHAHPNGYGLY